MVKVEKAIIPIAGMGTRFLPLSCVVQKEFFPLVDKPILHYIVQEAADAGIKEIIFVVKPGQEKSLDYFKRGGRLERLLKNKKKRAVLQELEEINRLKKKISFTWVFQKEALGDGHAVLMAKKMVGNKPCAVLFSDDIVETKIPCLKQMIKTFQRYRQPLIALYRIPRKMVSSYGIVGVKKINRRVYKISEVKEKPTPQSAPSRLAIVGKYIITPEVFNYLKRSPLAAGEIRLAGAFNQMADEGKKILGYEFEGKWLECGNKLAYLKSNLYLSLKHPQFGKELRRFLKKNL